MKPYKIIFLLVLIPAFLTAGNPNKKYKYTKEKVIKKEYQVNPDALLRIDNSFGNVDISTWSENRTVIEVVIKTRSNNEENAQQRLDEISIDFSATASLVSAKTIFKKRKKTWSWWGNKSNNSSMEIHYTIKIPMTNSVDISNDYGSINLNKLVGKATINCDYGQLIIGELLADNNLLNFDYTSKSTIGYMKSGVITADYSDFTLDEVEKLTLNADYTRSEILQVETLTYSCNYGKIVIGEVGSISGQGDYIPTHINTLTRELSINSDYGSIKIDDLAKSFERVAISADYTQVKIGFNAETEFTFQVNLTYADLKGKDYVTISKSITRNQSRKYTGYLTNSNTRSSISIDSEYGTVTFFKN